LTPAIAIATRQLRATDRAPGNKVKS